MKYDLVDKKDRLIKIGTKLEAKKLKLFTRSVHILLLNKEGKILLCKRSSNKETYPNKITSSAGGHVEQKESYIIAAKRELKEELGIVTALKNAGRFDIVNKQERAIHHLFIGKMKKIFPDPNEISSFSLMSVEEIKKDLCSHPNKYCMPFKEAFKCYFKYTQ